MNSGDLAQLSMLLDKKIKPIRDVFETIHQRLGSIEVNAAHMFNQIRSMHGLQSQINEELANRMLAIEKLLIEQQETLDSHTESLIKIEMTLHGYADAYQINKEQIDALQKQLDLPAGE